MLPQLPSWKQRLLSSSKVNQMHAGKKKCLRKKLCIFNSFCSTQKTNHFLLERCRWYWLWMPSIYYFLHLLHYNGSTFTVPCTESLAKLLFHSGYNLFLVCALITVAIFSLFIPIVINSFHALHTLLVIQMGCSLLQMCSLGFSLITTAHLMLNSFL